MTVTNNNCYIRFCKGSLLVCLKILLWILMGKTMTVMGNLQKY